MHLIHIIHGIFFALVVLHILHIVSNIVHINFHILYFFADSADFIHNSVKKILPVDCILFCVLIRNLPSSFFS